jgi:hypothetical protein
MKLPAETNKGGFQALALDSTLIAMPTLAILFWQSSVVGHPIDGKKNVYYAFVWAMASIFVVSILLFGDLKKSHWRDCVA